MLYFKMALRLSSQLISDGSWSSFTWKIISYDNYCWSSSGLGFRPFIICPLFNQFQQLKYYKYNFYADNLFIYLHVEPRNLTDAVCMINMDISNVANWASGNGLSLNPKKTMAIIMGTAIYIYIHSLSSYVLLRVTVNGITIPYNDSVEYLSVIISNTLSWEKQISKTTSRVFAAVHQLKMCKHFFPLALRIRLVLSLILPLLDYSCTAFTYFYFSLLFTYKHFSFFCMYYCLFVLCRLRLSVYCFCAWGDYSPERINK